MSKYLNEPFWVKNDQGFIKNGEISIPARLLDTIIRCYGKTPFPSQETLAKDMGYSPSSVKTIRKLLIELKKHKRVLSWKRRSPHSSNKYLVSDIFSTPKGKYHQGYETLSDKVLQPLLTGFTDPINYNQLNNYKLIQCFDDDFPFEQIDDVANDICTILEEHYITGFDLDQILSNLEYLISHYGHLDIFQYFTKLREVIAYGFESGNRVVDPYKLLCNALDYLDKRHYIEVITANPKPLKGESQQEYDARIDALRARGCPSSLKCSLCFEHDLTKYSEQFQFTYLDRKSSEIRKYIQRNVAFAQKLTVKEKEHILTILDDKIETPLCVDCILKFYIYT